MAEPNRRILSMDQFRGYTIVGMFVVNFLGGLPGIHATFKHHNTHFSYADSIMPSFFFAVGFSLRLALLRRLATQSAAGVYWKALRRCLLLILVSVMVFGPGVKIDRWNETFKTDWVTWNWKAEDVKADLQKVGTIVAKIVKGDLWETLALIGATSALVLPVIARSPMVRIIALLGCAVAHVGLSYWFNYNFVHGMPNWLDPYLGTVEKTSFDGGPFGIIAWAIPVLAGSLAYDVVVAQSVAGSFWRLAAWGTALMLAGYALSCLTTLYNVEGLSKEAFAAKQGFAASPVVPIGVSIEGRSLKSFFAEPPFVPPPPTDVRLMNYWMMSKRTVSISIALFAAGFAMALYSLFVVVCDGLGGGAGIFATFGANPLAAYIIHEIVMKAIKDPFVPKDSNILWSLDMFALFFALTYLFVRALEKQRIFIRL